MLLSRQERTAAPEKADIPTRNRSVHHADVAPLVSVVIPAYNAANTIAEALKSACAQSYRNLEIIVVDDGSTDDTGDIVRQIAAEDSRIRLIQTPNRGVAAARNRGIEEARADYVAMLDADDLWHPTKLQKQMEVMRSSPVEPGFVYCLYRNINADGLVTYSAPEVACRGNVLTRHVYVNFVGNGSSLLLRRDAIEAVGGFDPGLRQRGIEGCEDLLLQLKIASNFNVDFVPEYLVAYRQHPSMMSLDQHRMLRSRIAALELVREVAPHVPGYVFRWNLAQQCYRTALSCARRRRWGLAARLFARSFIHDPRSAFAKIRVTLQPRRPPAGLFASYSPSEGANPPSRLQARRLQRLSEIDAPARTSA